MIDDEDTHLEMLKEIERKLILIRDDIKGYQQLYTRNIKLSREIVAWENSFSDLIETFETLDYLTNTEKEAEGLKLKIINVIKMIKPKNIEEN